MFTATLYNNTGFNALNVPDKPSLLETAASSKKAVPTMDILQLYFNTKITIKAFEPDVMNSDYLKLTRSAEGNTPAMDAYYVISGYTMTSGDTIELSVFMDPFLTAGGIDNIDFLDGTTSRHHTSDNYINKYTEDDPLLVPTYPIQVKDMRLLFTTLANSEYAQVDGRCPYILVAVTSMPVGWQSAQDGDIGVRLNIPNTDYTETDQAGNTVYCTYNKAVPISTGSTYGTGGSFAVHSNYGWPNLPENINPIAGQFISMAATEQAVQKLKGYLANLAANGMLNLVQSVYYVPRRWLDKEYGSTSGGSQQTWGNDVVLVPNNGYVRGFYDYDELNADFVYMGMEDIGTGDDKIHNSRALSGKYNSLLFMSTASGDSRNYNPEELAFNRDAIGEFINPGDIHNVKIPVRGWSDVRPAGGVKFQVATAGSVKTYKQGDEYITRFEDYNNDIIKGGSWSKASLAYNSADNYNINKALFDMQQQAADLKADMESMSGISKEAAWTHTAVSGIPLIGAVYNAVAGSIGAVVDDITALKYSSYMNSDGSIDYGSAITSGDDRLSILANREVEKKAELAQFNAQNISTPKFVGNAESDYDPDFNALVVYKMMPHPEDIKKFDRILNQFGYKVSDVMDKSFLSNRRYYNYIETRGVSIKCDSIPKSVRDSLADAFNGGLRIWHRKPDVTLYDKYNPIVTNGGN